MQGVFEDDDNIHIVMELCLGGALMDRVKQVHVKQGHLGVSLLQQVCEEGSRMQRCKHMHKRKTRHV